MSHLNPGLISAYNSLTDKHLAGYFSNTRIRRHLHRAGLITRSGRIVPDKEYRHKLIQRAHQRHVRECLAQAIFHKVLELERLHQIEIKRKLEEFARRERVHKIKVERSKRYEEDIIRILSPHPPTGARGIRKQHSGPEGEHSESSESPSSSRPNTAPGKMQRPVRLKPIHSNSTTASVRRSSPYRLLESSHENNQSFNGTMDKESRRHLTTVEAPQGVSPYCLPVINNFVTPVPPATKRKERGVKVTPSSTIRGRRLRPTTASSGADVTEDPPMLRSSVHQSRVCVSMVYFGKTVHLSHDLSDMRDEVKVFQQHCGGENLCVFKGKLREGETFQFISRRHRGFPFSLTFFLNGLQVERLSSCCEFKHRKGSRLGGRHGHFGFFSVEGASPCYKCIIAMGLDKKPTPPSKRVKEDRAREDSDTSLKDTPEMLTERTAEGAASHSECETSHPQDMETQGEDETAHEEDKVRDDYEEDFEADDEGPAEGAEAKANKSPSPSSETEKQVEEKDASESEDDEKDEDIKSGSGSSSSASDREESDAEATKDSKEDEKTEQPQEADPEEAVAPPDQKDEPNPEEDVPAEATVSAVAKDSDMQDSAGDSTEIEISDTSVPTASENKESGDTSEDKEKMVEESKQQEEQERAKSVQEKLAEAILKESQCSSEPELSDTSTEEEEECADKKDNNDASLEKPVTLTEQQQTSLEETRCEESVAGEGEVEQGPDESFEIKVQMDESEARENICSKDEKVSEVEEDEKSAVDEVTGEKDQSEEPREAQHPINEENDAQDDKTDPLLEEVKSTDAEAAEKDDEKEEETAAETDGHLDETTQVAESREEDESSVSEQNKKTDETALPVNAEAEVMTASETTELKAESSEEREALSCEEAPVNDTEETQQGDEDGTAEVAAEDSNSSPKEDGDTAAENPADISEENGKNEGGQDESKGEVAEQTLSIEAESQQEGCELGQERKETTVEIHDTVEKQKSEEEEEQTPDKTEDENTDEKVNDEKDTIEEEGNDESKTHEKIEKKENVAESSENDTNTEGKEYEEEGEKKTDEEDKVAHEEKVDEPGETGKDEGSEGVENKNDKEEPEAEGADKTNKFEERADTDVAVEQKDEDVEKSEKGENKAEQREGTEKKEVANKTAGEGEEMSEITEEPEKSADAELDKESVKLCSENVVESEDVDACEATDESKTAEEVPNNMADVEGESERASNKSVEGEIDAENGEISTGAEGRALEDPGEDVTKDKNDLKTAECGEAERNTEEHTEDESRDVKESGESADKHEDEKVDQAPDVVESVAKGDDDSVQNHDKLNKNNSESETSGTEIKESVRLDDRKGNEEDENGNKSDLDNENRESHLIKKNSDIQNVISEVASSGDQEQSAAPVSFDLDELRTEEFGCAGDNAACVDLPATEGENGADTEEASKVSEEGASVLLKPQAPASEADNTEQGLRVGKETPEALAREDNTDLVSKWVNVHQTSKYFETFVEPLEDLSEGISDSNKDKPRPTELLRKESPPSMVRMPEDEEEDDKVKYENESREEAKMEAVDFSNTHAGDEEFEKDPAKNRQHVEETEVKGLIPEAESEQSDSANVQDMRSDESKGSRRSLQEDEVQEEQTQGINEDKSFSRTEVESISGTHHSAASGKPESVSENQTEEKTTDLSVKPASTEETKDLPSLKGEERHESKSPEEDASETWRETDQQSREVTEITDFTTSKSDDGSQEIRPKALEGSISGDRRDVQLIRDLKHTLSKDRLSTFSVDETLFGRSSYPLLTVARTESGH